MIALVTVEDLFALYETRGHEQYGESVSQLSHALQCAARARRAGAANALVVAALFHDLGHLVADVPGVTDRPLHAPDDVHEARGARILAPIFGPSVAQPVALHVTAKRWRCTREPSYYEQLSLTSRDSLRAQGGLLSDEQCARFESHPGFDDAVALRAWDDSAKDPSGATDSLCDYQSLVDAVADAR